MKVLTNSQNEKVAWLLQPFAVPSRSLCGKRYTERPPQAAQIWELTLEWGGVCVREKKEMTAWRDFGHFANVTLQERICNYIPGKKGSGSTAPQALAETEHLGWMWGCQQKGQDQEHRRIQTRWRWPPWAVLKIWRGNKPQIRHLSRLKERESYLAREQQ